MSAVAKKEAVILAFFNEKGGIGKTSTTFNVAWELAKTKKVLLIDLDGQRANLTFHSGAKTIIEKEIKESIRIRMEVDPNREIYEPVTIKNVLSGEKEVTDAIIPLTKNLSIIPGTIDVVNLGEKINFNTFRKAIDKLSQMFDYIFIDNNPDPTLKHFLTLSVCKYVYVLSIPDVACLESGQAVVESIEAVTTYDKNLNTCVNPDLRVLGILYNNDENRTILSKNTKAKAEELAKKLKTKVLPFGIRRNSKVGEAVLAHIGITDYEPKCTAAQDILEVVNDIKRRAK